MPNDKKSADICLFLEGTYPYIAGGVSSWVHELLCEHSDLTFALVSVLPRDGETIPFYDFPENVVSHQNVFLQKLDKGEMIKNDSERKLFFNELKGSLSVFQSNFSLDGLRKLIDHLKTVNVPLGFELLLDSKDSWNMLTEMYESSYSKTNFLTYYWSTRGINSSIYSILLADLPKAHVYHSVSTGYAGLFLARAFVETGKPCFVTEHGIYTHERRMDIISSDWLDEKEALSMTIKNNELEKNLKEFWINVFASFSKLTYDASTSVITLFEGNIALQTLDGAPLEKVKVIPNGIDFEQYETIERKSSSKSTIAFIGRVVPIKDVKTFINAMGLLNEKIPNLEVLIIGPCDEDEEYSKECFELVTVLGLEETITFVGKIKNVKDYLSKTDLVVLTSVSETQPLVVLEAGAAAIPCVVTDVGACREMILGKSDEDPPLGSGGAVCSLCNPRMICDEAFKLLNDPAYYEACSQAIQKRVKKYYHVNDQRKSYDTLYKGYLSAEVV